MASGEKTTPRPVTGWGVAMTGVADQARHTPHRLLHQQSAPCCLAEGNGYCGETDQ